MEFDWFNEVDNISHACFYVFRFFTLYLEDHRGNDAEGNIKEADVGGRDDVLHEEPVGHPLVILTEVPKIVHDAPQELSWQVQQHCHFHFLESLLSLMTCSLDVL